VDVMASHLIFELFNSLAPVMVIGALLSLTFYLPEQNGFFTESSVKSKRWLLLSLSIWAIASLGNLLSTLAYIFETSILNILDYMTIRSYVSQTALGKLQFIQLILIVCVAIFSRLIKKTGGSLILLVFTMIALSAPLFQSHSSQSGSHGLAIGSIIIHVFAISFWIGSVISLLWSDSSQREALISRISRVATWSAVAVLFSGGVNSWTRLRLSQDWFTPYGLGIAIKIVLSLLVIIVARRISKEFNSSKFILIELMIFFIIVSIGALIDRVTPVSLENVPYDPIREIVGISMPAEPTLQRVLFSYEASGLILGLLIFITALYIRGVIALTQRGDNWPIGRTISFAIGISAIDYATSGGLGLYSHFSFQYHMIAHMVISMIAPIFLILSAPITLALRTLPIAREKNERGIRGLLLSILHSRSTGIWTHPVTALAIFDGSLFALYFTPAFGNLMGSHFGHIFMTLHFLGAGLLFFFVIVGVDPNPRQVHHLVRIVILFAAMSIHAFFSIALMSSTTLIDNGYYAALTRPWATDLLADQRVGAAIGWAMGEVPIILALIATFIQWMRSDAREAKRQDRRSEVDLAAYNQYLEELHKRNE
jgi:cytochrome c oxidase assembly factor CtaG